MVRALFDHAALVEDEDAVRVSQRAQTMGNRQGRPAAGQHTERLLDRFLRLGIHAAGGLIQNQDLGIVEQGPGDRDTLPLAAGEPRPASPSQVSYPSGERRMKSWACAAREAVIASMGLASGRP